MRLDIAGGGGGYRGRATAVGSGGQGLGARQRQQHGRHCLKKIDDGGDEEAPPEVGRGGCIIVVEQRLPTKKGGGSNRHTGAGAGDLLQLTAAARRCVRYFLVRKRIIHFLGGFWAAGARHGGAICGILPPPLLLPAALRALAIPIGRARSKSRIRPTSPRRTKLL